MTDLFLDCEFDGFNGPLISLALVPADKRLPELYFVTNHQATDEWVIKHVMSVVGPAHRWDPKDLPVMLNGYLMSFEEPVRIIADWPDDFAYLMKAMLSGPGMMPPIKYPVAMLLDTSLPGTAHTSQVPHNALWDARALRDSYKAKHDLSRAPSAPA